jgi:hypothetical protein
MSALMPLALIHLSEFAIRVALIAHEFFRVYF